MKLEYLVHTDSNESFCQTAEAFSTFLTIDSKLSVSENTITLIPENQNKITTKYNISTGLVAGKDERYFLIILLSDEESKIDEFYALGQAVIEIAKRLKPEHTRINTLWDDVGRHYAKLSYPYIYDTENVMRKLISQFMLINVGVDWSREALSPSLISKIEGNNENNVENKYFDELFRLDFIQLSEVLFHKKSDISEQQVYRLLAKTDFNDRDKKQLKKYLPQSNWEKYFSEILGVKEKELKDKWLLLYKQRNHVAHNRNISKEIYKQIKGMCRDVEKILMSAINKLPDIKLVEEDKVNIRKSIRDASNIMSAYYAEEFMSPYYFDLGFDTRVLYANAEDAYLNVSDSSESIGVSVKFFGTEKEVINPAEFWDHELEEYEAFTKNNDLSRIEFVYIFPHDFILKSLYFSRVMSEFQILLDSRKKAGMPILVGYLNSESVFQLVRKIEYSQ